MTIEEKNKFIAREYIWSYLWGEHSDNPCEYYKYDVPCTKDCINCFLSWLDNIEYKEVDND